MFVLFLILLTLVESKRIPECEKNYVCLTIEKCKSLSGTGTTLTRYKGTEDIITNCPVFFKFHSNTAKFIHVSIESFDSNVKHIELKSKKDNRATDVEPVYSCTRGGTSAIASSADGFIKNVEARSNPLMCNFTVTTTDKEAPFQPDFGTGGGMILALIDNIHTDAVRYTSLDYTRFCDPKSLLSPTDEIDSDKSYRRAEYVFGSVSCPNEIFRLEFRKEYKYEVVEKITCNTNTPPFFEITYKHGPPVIIYVDEDEIDARCVADAWFFCDYKPAMTVGQTELEVILPNIDINPKKAGSIKCPANSTFLVIAGRKPQKDFEINCKNLGGNMRWTVNDTVLHQTGPFVHCVEKVDCHIMNKIPRENLIGSHLDDKFNPACHQGGTLKIKQGSDNEIDVESVKCDADTGEYKYVKKDEEYSVAPGSIFTCTYDDPNKENEEENAATMKMTGVTVFLVVFFVVAAIAGIVLFFRWRQLKQMEKQLKMSSAIDEKRFAMKEEESGQTKKENGDLLANDFLSCKKREESTKFKTYDKYDKLESKKVRKEEDVFPILMENDKNRGLRKVEKLPMEKNETILHHEQAADAAAAKRKEKEDGEKEGAKTDSKKNV